MVLVESAWLEQKCRFFVNGKCLGLVANFWHTPLVLKCILATIRMENLLYIFVSLSLSKKKMALLSEMRVLVLLQKARLLASHLVIGDANVNAMVFWS